MSLPEKDDPRVRYVVYKLVNRMGMHTIKQRVESCPPFVTKEEAKDELQKMYERVGGHLLVQREDIVGEFGGKDTCELDWGDYVAIPTGNDTYDIRCTNEALSGMLGSCIVSGHHNAHSAVALASTAFRNGRCVGDMEKGGNER